MSLATRNTASVKIKLLTKADILAFRDSSVSCSRPIALSSMNLHRTCPTTNENQNMAAQHTSDTTPPTTTHSSPERVSRSNICLIWSA